MCVNWGLSRAEGVGDAFRGLSGLGEPGAWCWRSRERGLGAPQQQGTASAESCAGGLVGYGMFPGRDSKLCGQGEVPLVGSSAGVVEGSRGIASEL